MFAGGRHGAGCHVPGLPSRAVRAFRRNVHVYQTGCRQRYAEQVALLCPGRPTHPNRPRDWTSPVDYRNGTVHIRAEVIEKPEGGEPTTWTLCYIPNKGQGNGYGCTGTELYREKGIYEKDVAMTSFWENDAIVWTEGIKRMDLVIKDGSGGSGHAHKRPDAEHFFPTRVRITMVQVSAGSKYDPNLVPKLKTGSAAY